MIVAEVTADGVRLLVLLLALALGVAVIARMLRFPYTLALVLVGLLLGAIQAVPQLHLTPDVVLFIFLPALLFEGSLTVNVRTLLANWVVVGLLAVPGLIISLVAVAVVLHIAVALPWLEAALIGAIVSPTDPVAVVGLLRQLGMPTRLRTIIEGESLFNDGLGAAAYVIVLGVLLALSTPGSATDGAVLWPIALHALWLFVGGPLLGCAAGVLAARLLRHVDDHLFETTLTVILAYGIYLIADALGTSPLLAVVCAGLIVGSYGRRVGMSAQTQDTLDTVWEFIGYVANSFLFLAVGLEIGATSLVGVIGPIGWAIAAVVVGRALMIALLLPLNDGLARWLTQRRAPHQKRSALAPTVLPRIWRPLVLLSGLRGALSLALALNLPATLAGRSLIERVVYGVVLVTLVGQGIGMHLLLPRWPRVAPTTLPTPQPSEAAMS